MSADGATKMSVLGPGYMRHLGCQRELGIIGEFEVVAAGMAADPEEMRVPAPGCPVERRQRGEPPQPVHS